MATVQAFIDELEGLVRTRVEALGTASASGEAPALSIVELLFVALRNELEASEEAALWMTLETDVEVKLALARQCGDEARHFRLIEERLRELGADPASRPVLAQGYTPMFQFLKGLGSTVERVAAGPFAREALAQVRNEVFIAHCEAQGDVQTAKLYREQIQPDEAHHHRLGRSLLLRLAADEPSQTRARAAALRTLEIAGELQEIARLKSGACRLPGC